MPDQVWRAALKAAASVPRRFGRGRVVVAMTRRRLVEEFRMRITAVCVCVALLATACGTSEAAPALREVSPATITSLAEVPSPEEPVLELDKDGVTVGFDLAALDQLRQVETTVYEPFLEDDVVFSGVLLSELISLVGADGRTTAHFLALDDYEVELTLADVASSGVLLATRQAGEEIPIEEGGPTRLLFPDGSELGRNLDLWVWSVKEITLR